MKTLVTAGLGLSVALLTACAATPAKQAAADTTATTTTTTAPVATASAPVAATNTFTQSVRQFDCNTGISVLVKYLNTEQVAVQVQNYAATLTIAPAASGSRYVATQGLFGFGGEWHEKGNMGVFAAKNVHGTPIQMTCQAA